mgnify:FL=1|jgi:hypothetical protein
MTSEWGHSGTSLAQNRLHANAHTVGVSDRGLKMQTRTGHAPGVGTYLILERASSPRARRVLRVSTHRRSLHPRDPLQKAWAEEAAPPARQNLAFVRTPRLAIQSIQNFVPKRKEVVEPFSRKPPKLKGRPESADCDPRVAAPPPPSSRSGFGVKTRARGEIRGNAYPNRPVRIRNAVFKPERFAQQRQARIGTTTPSVPHRARARPRRDFPSDAL